ncbi:hypothetical protein GCM10010255_40700 [Streptomyces coeruleofuscus]|uniref:Transposase n=1 Tax=Streptomyces coeruleofuscus TaxID=66879 RepID=A0ABP5VK65_9ACTN
MLDRFPDRVFALDEFGPLGIRPTAGSGWAERKHPDRLPATYHRTHGVRYFHGCYSVGDDTLWGANPIEAHFGPLRQFTIANSHHPNHIVQTRALHAYLRWRNANARHRDVLAAERKERARIRSEKGIRWGGRPLQHRSLIQPGEPMRSQG